MTSNMGITKIASMTENYPEFLVVNLNYAGGHAGHQIKILVTKNEILVDKIEPCLNRILLPYI